MPLIYSKIILMCVQYYIQLFPKEQERLRIVFHAFNTIEEVEKLIALLVSNSIVKSIGQVNSKYNYKRATYN